MASSSAAQKNKNQTQSSLHSFFGSGGQKKTKKNLTGDCDSQKGNETATGQSKTKTKTNAIDTNNDTTNCADESHVNNTDASTLISSNSSLLKNKRKPAVSLSSSLKTVSTSANKDTLGDVDRTNSLRRKRRIFEDSDDEENNTVEDNVVTPSSDTKSCSFEAEKEGKDASKDKIASSDHSSNVPILVLSEKMDEAERIEPKEVPSALQTVSSNKNQYETDYITQQKSTKSEASFFSGKASDGNSKDEQSKQSKLQSKAQKTHTSNDTHQMATERKPEVPSSILAAAGKDQFKSDDAIISSIPTSWDEEMPYSVLCNAFYRIEEITSRLQIQEILTNLFRQVLLKKPSEMYTVLYLSSNSVAPAYQCVELGIGDAILIKAIGEATGTNPSIVKQKYEAEGDLGTVAKTFKSKQSTLGGFFKTTTTTGKSKTNKYLSVSDVLTTFRKIANTKGNQSQKLKVDSIKHLLVKASDPEETKYIIRGLQGKLRIGLAQSTVLISLAHALALTIPNTVNVNLNDIVEKTGDEDDIPYPDEAKQFMDKSQTVEKRIEAAVAIIKKAYSEVPSYDAILDAALKVPLELLHRACTLTPGIPVAPMLAKPTKSVQEVLKRLNGLKFTVEYKYDGERAQIHMLSDGTTKVFSRNLLDTSEKYPEVPMFVKEAAAAAETNLVTSFVLDTEVVAFNNKTGQLVPFQILSTRKKTEESAETAKVQVIVQAFDLMYLNGMSLLGKTLAERRSLLRQHFVPVDGKFQFAKSLDHEENGDTAIIEEFLESAVKGQCEGLMVKTLEQNAIYEPSRRSLNWLKLKKDYLEGLGDSVDLVPLGAYHGRGKRTGVYGAYLLACYDPDTEEFQSVCKIGTGFSDEDLQTLSDNLNKHKIPTKTSQYNVSDQLDCDVWFDTVQVWEVKAADLSKSSAHRGATGKTGENGRGIGLRFPRFERVRDDKNPDEATTSDQILEMYYEQDAIGTITPNGGCGDDDDDDDGI